MSPPTATSQLPGTAEREAPGPIRHKGPRPAAVAGSTHGDVRRGGRSFALTA